MFSAALCQDFISLQLSWWTVLRLNPFSAKQWISQMQLAVTSSAKYYIKMFLAVQLRANKLNKRRIGGNKLKQLTWVGNFWSEGVLFFPSENFLSFLMKFKLKLKPIWQLEKWSLLLEVTHKTIFKKQKHFPRQKLSNFSCSRYYKQVTAQGIVNVLQNH